MPWSAGELAELPGRVVPFQMDGTGGKFEIIWARRQHDGGTEILIFIGGSHDTA
jgi:hypothetical protein